MVIWCDLMGDCKHLLNPIWENSWRWTMAISGTDDWMYLPFVMPISKGAYVRGYPQSMALYHIQRVYIYIYIYIQCVYIIYIQIIYMYIYSWLFTYSLRIPPSHWDLIVIDDWMFVRTLVCWVASVVTYWARAICCEPCCVPAFAKSPLFSSVFKLFLSHMVSAELLQILYQIMIVHYIVVMCIMLLFICGCVYSFNRVVRTNM